MGMDYQVWRAWANTSKGIRQCQKVDKAILNDNADAASKHFDKAARYFAFAAEHLAKAEDDASVKAGRLLEDGNQQLQKAIDEYGAGHAERAQKHYEDALDKYDEALDLVD